MKGVVLSDDCNGLGTAFMMRLSKHFEFFIQMKINSDERWKNLTVVFSGAEVTQIMIDVDMDTLKVPGEGEHKIMEFLRMLQKNSKSEKRDDEVTHCLYGLDADLIM